LPEFYSDSPEPALRFGDIVSGFQSASPHIDNPNLGTEKIDLQINVSQPPYFVVMTPCCSIADGTIALAPLGEIRQIFFMNPFLEEDLTRVNNPNVPPENSVSPKQLESMSPVEKQLHLSKVPGYVFLDCFVYAPHELLSEYTIKKGEFTRRLRHRLVDFRHIARVDCKQVVRGSTGLKKIKVLQLAIPTRESLRNKLVQYFARQAAEDKSD
jgi:hypothetical protein